MRHSQNITVALPRELLRRVRHLAVERETSVSRLLAETLEDLVKEEDAYHEARRFHQALLAEDLDLGTGGAITWDRDSLHER